MKKSAKVQTGVHQYTFNCFFILLLTAFCEILGLVILNLAIAFSLYEVALFFIKSARQNKKLRQLSENLHKIHPVQSIRLKGGYLQDRAKKLWSSSEDNKDVEKKKK